MKRLFILAAVLATAGVAALAIAAQTPAYVDAQGILHEPFAWMAAGRLALLLAAGFAAVAGAMAIVRRRRG